MAKGQLGIAGYEKPVEIGRGGFGTVFRARQPKFNRTVAIKVLNSRPGENAQKRFERECRALGTLSGHPNIVEVYDAGQTKDGLPFLTTAYVSGGTLADRLEEEGVLSPADAVEITIKLAGALATAHAYGVLHRDIKPENVLASNYGEPLLADFGLARLQSEKSVTRTAGVTASFAHAAPEILEGLPATEASDVYALGSTLYTLLAGRPPFVHDTDETLTPLIARVIRDPLPELQSAGVSGDVWACIEGAMAKHPDDRILTARDLGERLQTTQVAAGVPVTPLRLGSPESASVDEIVGPQAAGATRRVAGRKSRSQARTATDRQLQTPRIPAPVASPPSGPPPPPAAPPFAPSTPAAKSSKTPLLVAGIVVAVLGAGVGVAAALGAFSGGGSNTTSGSTSTSGTTASTSLEAQAKADAMRFGSMLDRNSGARMQVVDAVNGVSSCRISGNAGASALAVPIATRQSIVDELDHLDVAALKEGAQLRSTLRTAMEDSIAADRHYQDWMHFVAGQSCNGQAVQNADYSAANASSEAATGSKRAFVTAWNPVAARYTLRPMQETDI